MSFGLKQWKMRSKIGAQASIYYFDILKFFFFWIVANWFTLHMTIFCIFKLPSEAWPPRHWLCAWANPTVPTWTLVPKSSAFQPHTLCPFINKCSLEIPVPQPVTQAAEMPCCVLVIKALVALPHSQWSRSPGTHSVEMGGKKELGVRMSTPSCLSAC